MIAKNRIDPDAPSTETDRPRVLLVDDDVNSLEALEEMVQAEDYETFTATDLSSARAHLEESTPDLVLSDLMLPDGRGTELIEELENEPDVEVILITANASVESAVDALRLGAYDYLTKPVDVARLKTLLVGFRRTLQLKREVGALRSQLKEIGRFGDMVGTSAPVQEIYSLVERVAPTDASVLVTGESGTGKELVAQTVHQLSHRNGNHFVPVNCGAIAETLIESELFGHEKGAFTGADRRHRGFFERAHHGTVFLDEITEMPTELQVKLLRVLETGKVRRVGGLEEIDVDVRVIAASNRDPDEAVEEGELREDLLYRLRVFPIELPPLRDRGDDIRQLAVHFLEHLNRREKTQKTLSRKALDRLLRHAWPGNVRELKNLIERAFILADREIGVDQIPIDPDGRPAALGPYLQVRVGSSVAEVEKRLIYATLDEYDGNKKKTAETLGVSLKTLYNRLNAYAEEQEEEDAEGEDTEAEPEESQEAETENGAAEDDA